MSGVCVGYEVRAVDNGALVAQRHTGNDVGRVAKSGIAHSAGVEVLAGIEGDESCLNYAVYGSESKAGSEAQRAIVKYFGGLVAPREYDGVVDYTSGHTVAQCRPHGVAVHAEPMVDVIRDSVDIFLRRFFGNSLQRVDNLPSARACLGSVEVFKYRAGSGMFEENVIPVGTLSLGLCRGAVCTEADEVVFPCKVIGAFGIDASDSYVAEAYRSVAQCYPAVIRAFGSMLT